MGCNHGYWVTTNPYFVAFRSILMKSKDDMCGCKPLKGSKPVEKTKYVGYKWGTGEENVATKKNGNE